MTTIGFSIQDSHRDRTARDLEKTEREIRRLIEAIKSGVPGAALTDELASLESQRIDLHRQLEGSPLSVLRLPPKADITGGGVHVR